MTEAVISEFARISSLSVISRTSVIQYKRARKPLPEIAQELGVDVVVEGTVMRSGDRVRITVQLVDAPRDRHLWTERYDRDLSDVLALQSDVALAVVVVLNFIKNGSAEQREANSGYGSEMFGLMAEMGNGPTHVGAAVTLEGEADFDNVVIVYYAGVEYFAEMLQSEFFTGIVGGKQLGDTLSSPTVPLLPHL